MFLICTSMYSTGALCIAIPLSGPVANARTARVAPRQMYFLFCR